MQLQISGQHISIGNSLKEYVQEKMQHVVLRYFADAPDAHVYFAKNPHHDINCDIVVHEGTGRHIMMNSNCASDEAYSAFDNALNKLEKQLRKYKSKLKDYRKRVKISSEEFEQAIKYVIAPAVNEEIAEELFNVDNPVIIAEKPLSMMMLSVGEAVMKMDLENLPALMFRNIKTKRINVVYYKKDGNISWVDYVE
jgi:ribosomal subunit interface protein